MVTAPVTQKKAKTTAAKKAFGIAQSGGKTHYGCPCVASRVACLLFANACLEFLCSKDRGGRWEVINKDSLGVR